jgi:hypothetical protein
MEAVVHGVDAIGAACARDARRQGENHGKRKGADPRGPTLSSANPVSSDSARHITGYGSH